MFTSIFCVHPVFPVDFSCTSLLNTHGQKINHFSDTDVYFAQHSRKMCVFVGFSGVIYIAASYMRPARDMNLAGMIGAYEDGYPGPNPARDHIQPGPGCCMQTASG